MLAEEAIGLGGKPALPDEAHHPPGILPESPQEIRHHRFERPQAVKGLVTNAVFNLVPEFLDGVQLRTVGRKGDQAHVGG